MDSDSHSPTFSIQDEGLFHVTYISAQSMLIPCAKFLAYQA